MELKVWRNKSVAEVERQMTKVEPEGPGSPLEPEGRRFQVGQRERGAKVEATGRWARWSSALGGPRQGHGIQTPRWSWGPGGPRH